MENILYKRQSDETIGACIEVHKLMGPNLSEKIYEACVQKRAHKLRLSRRQTKIDRYLFQRKKLDEPYRIDMLVANKLILESKTVPDSK